MKTTAVEIPVLIDKISTMSDGTIKLVLGTRELPPSMMSELFSMRQQEAWAVIAPHHLNEAAIPKETPDAGIDGKSHSQRLRSVLYVLYKQVPRNVSFDEYYAVQMERVMTAFKEKIEVDVDEEDAIRED